MNLPLRTRIISASLLFVAIICAIFFTYATQKESADARSDLKHTIEQNQQLMKVVIASPLYDGNIAELNADLDSFFMNPDMLEITLKEHKGNIHLSRKRDAPAISGNIIQTTFEITRGTDRLGEIHTVYTTSNIEREIASSRNDILLFSLAILLTLTIVIYYVAKGVSRPIDRLTRAAQAMANGDLYQSIDGGGVQELRVLADSFGRMRDAIQEKMDSLVKNNLQLKKEIEQRRNAELERDRLNSIIEATPDLVSMADPKGNMLYLNRAGREMLGVALDKELSTIIVKVHPQWASDLILKEGLPSAIKEGSWSGETAIIGPDGREIPVSQVIICHKDEQGKMIYMSTIMRDITERKRVEHRNQVLLQRHNVMMRSSFEGIHIMDEFGNIFEANETFCRMLGYTQEEAMHLNVVDWDANWTRDELMGRLQELIHTDGAVFETRHRRKDGTVFDVEVITTGAEIDGKRYLYASSHDISERKRFEESLRMSDERLRQAIDVSRIGIFDHDQVNETVYWSAEARNIYGWGADEVVGLQAFIKCIHPADIERIGKEISKAHDPGGTGIFVVEHRIVRRDGAIRWINTRSRTFFEGAGAERRPIRTIGATIDVTERRNAEEELRQLNEELEMRVAERTAELAASRDEAERANVAKSEFLSRMSHELRTPLNAILGFGQLLAMEKSLQAEQSDNVKEILHAGQHLLDLINEVLDLARIESGKFTISKEPLPLAPMMADCITLIRPVADAQRIPITEVGSGCVDFVQADRTRLKQVLINLLSNAVKYNRPNGTVGIVCMRQGEWLQIRISDTGHGLTPEQQVRLFTPFERLNADQTGIEGTGIGLALCKRLMEIMGGEIGVESTLGTGSTFWIRLPLATGPSDHALPVSAGPYQRSSSAGGQMQSTVLCIEDNPANLRLVERVLAQRPAIHLLTATTPKAGLELAASYLPSLILLDINLPDMDGYAVMQCLRESDKTRDIPVVAISANAMPKDLARGEAAGFMEYLTKPLEVNKLLQVVDEVIADATGPG